jgi:ABC-type lipoprotein export system ATPase subunit
MSDPILRAENVKKSYMMGPGPLRVLRGASLRVSRGELVAIMGASGSGKSTLLHILGALDTPDEGTVHFAGTDVFGLSGRLRDRMRNRNVGFVFQFYHLLPELNVLENILFPAMVRHSLLYWMRSGKRARQRARDVLASVGLGERADHRPNELSGGERQRAAIARALVNEPELLLADEPTGNLDSKTGEGILKVLEKLNAGGQTIVMVTHDENVAKRAHRCVHLADGQIVRL